MPRTGRQNARCSPRLHPSCTARQEQWRRGARNMIQSMRRAQSWAGTPRCGRFTRPAASHFGRRNPCPTRINKTVSLDPSVPLRDAECSSRPLCAQPPPPTVQIVTTHQGPQLLSTRDHVQDVLKLGRHALRSPTVPSSPPASTIPGALRSMLSRETNGHTSLRRPAVSELVPGRVRRNDPHQQKVARTRKSVLCVRLRCRQFVLSNLES